MLKRIKVHDQHEGEIFVQNKRHTPSNMPMVVSNMISDDMPDQHSEFFTHLSYFAISTIDIDGRPWATIIVGSPTTLIRAISEMELNISAVLPKDDPFLSSIINTVNSPYRSFAGIGVDFSNRRRNKVAGFIATSNIVNDTLNMSLLTNENVGNCPKYITIRKLEYCKRNPQIAADYRNTDRISFNQECLDIINQASTIFLATRHTSTISDNTSDLGINHRGGYSGFVRTYEENGYTYIVIPDYSGNRFYQSLGNIETDRVAGVVFPCFTSGDMLHVTGIAENIYDDEAECIMPRITLLTRIKLTGYVWIKEGLNLKLIGPEQYSPYNPPIRYLAIELEKMGKPSTVSTRNAKLIEIKKLTKLISRFTFELDEKVSFKPGGYVILDFAHLIPQTYQHMNNNNPQSLNDDYIRTWTISSSPPFNLNTNTFDATNQISCTIKHLPKGTISSLLHSQSNDEKSPLSCKFLGVGGEFTCFDNTNQPPQKLLFIAAGIGITPLLAMFEALSRTKQKTDIVVLFSGRGDEIDLLKDFISSPLVSNISMFDSTGVNTSKSLQVFNRRIQYDDLLNVADLMNRQVYLCGPTQFMIDITSWLNQTGLKSEQIKTESFFF
ncbi:unnamed protein product [Adineta steineri]|uniref:FAD-binding FR-type domain-containing protein n=1 Tax=Adineta steineri TaxID=433720 RepID=A0A819CFS5_9BILA|nr:unnamed protein product [Adineta steineri]